MKYFMTAFSCKTKTPFVYIKISKSVKLELSVNYRESLESRSVGSSVTSVTSHSFPVGGSQRTSPVLLVLDPPSSSDS